MQTISEDEEFKGDNRILEILITKDEQAAQNIGDPSAFRDLYDEDKGIDTVAEAMLHQESAEEFDKSNSSDEFDFFSSLGIEEESKPSVLDEIVESPSFYEDDLKYASQALRFLQESQKIDARFEDDRIEIHASAMEDLKYRFKMLPREVRPDDWHFKLSNDLELINQEIKASRKNESAWPNIHYLWEQHPVLEWIKDKYWWMIFLQFDNLLLLQFLFLLYQNNSSHLRRIIY